MPRALWKGAITFGLVHIPVALYSAAKEDELDFNWLDRRSMDPVGYRRINKRTGDEIQREDIVKGIEYEPGHYVVLTDEEIRGAYPKTTQTIEIEAFVDAHDIPLAYLEKPYYLAPIGRGGEKVYALLRESLRDSGRVGIARVVIQTKQHLAALMPDGDALVLNTLRWASEIRSRDELDLPAQGRKGANLNAAELKMAAQLIDSMAADWDPGQYSDRFRDAVMELVERKAQAGEIESVEPVESLEGEPEADRSNVIDLTELLRRSLKKGVEGKGAEGKGTEGKGTEGKGTEAKGVERKAAAARKRAAPKSTAATKRAAGSRPPSGSRRSSSRGAAGAGSAGRRSA